MAGESPLSRWMREVVLLGAFYVVYESVRLAVRSDWPRARANGLRVVGLERGWHVALDHSLNAYVTARPGLAVPACFAYASLHDVVTLSVLVWLWRRRPDAYRAARAGLVVATLLALAAFWLLPVAPPRLLPGFADTMLTYGGYGWWGSAAGGARGAGHLAANQFAAMPSLHVGWAAWCGWHLVRRGGAAWPRAIGAGYPVLMGAVVVGTANHYLLDAVAGVAVAAAGLLCVRGSAVLAGLVSRKRAVRRERAVSRRRTPAGPDGSAGRDAQGFQATPPRTKR